MGDILTYVPEVLSLRDPQSSIHFFPDSFEFIPIILSMRVTMFLPIVIPGPHQTPQL